MKLPRSARKRGSWRPLLKWRDDKRAWPPLKPTETRCERHFISKLGIPRDTIRRAPRARPCSQGSPPRFVAPGPSTLRVAGRTMATMSASDFQWQRRARRQRGRCRLRSAAIRHSGRPRRRACRRRLRPRFTSRAQLKACDRGIITPIGTRGVPNSTTAAFQTTPARDARRGLSPRLRGAIERWERW